MPPALSSFSSTSSLALAWVKTAVTSSRRWLTAEALILPSKVSTNTRFLALASVSFSVFCAFLSAFACFFLALCSFFSSAFCSDSSMVAISIASDISSYCWLSGVISRWPLSPPCLPLILAPTAKLIIMAMATTIVATLAKNSPYSIKNSKCHSKIVNKSLRRNQSCNLADARSCLKLHQ